MPVPKALSAVRRLTPAGFNSWAFCMAHHAANAGTRSRTSAPLLESHEGTKARSKKVFFVSSRLRGNPRCAGRAGLADRRRASTKRDDAVRADVCKPLALA